MNIKALKKILIVVAASGWHSASALATSPCDNVSATQDDWQFNPVMIDASGPMSLSLGGGGGAMAASMPMASSIGLSVGGAKDIDNFRHEISENKLPQASDVTYEGLFYDYTFDTGLAQSCQQIFCPLYSAVQSKDPLTGADEYFMAIGLNSGLTQAEAARKQLNLVVVLDISGSMSAEFNKYYYDQFGIAHEIPADEVSQKTKMEVAKQSIINMLDHLKPEDQLAIVLFDQAAYLAKPLNHVCKTDLEALRNHLEELQPMGGTNFEAGYAEGSSLYNALSASELNPTDRENRMIFLTDAMPNTGELDDQALLKQIEQVASRHIFTTFIGIGLDFNAELIEAVTKVKGANYYSVYSEESFKKRLDDEFEFMINPLAFNVSLYVDSKDIAIEAVYGSPEADASLGQVLHVKTLFPSASVDGAVKGGIILVKLKNPAHLTNPEASIHISYENRAGQTLNSEWQPQLGFAENVYPNTGLHKGVLLTRYAGLLKEWIDYERSQLASEVVIRGLPSILIPPGQPVPSTLSEWELTSAPLVVSPIYNEKFTNFLDYFVKEANIIGDSALSQETVVLEKLSTY